VAQSVIPSPAVTIKIGTSTGTLTAVEPRTGPLYDLMSQILLELRAIRKCMILLVTEELPRHARDANELDPEYSVELSRSEAN
jgi:hypothetical protein